LKVAPAFAGNTVVGTTAACTDGNAAPAAAGSTPLAVTLLIFTPTTECNLLDNYATINNSEI
jgi:hypothetical protein